MQKMPLEQQIAHFEIQKNNVVKQLLSEKKPSVRKKLDTTALFFRDVIESLKELKEIKDQQKQDQELLNKQKVIEIKETT